MNSIQEAISAVEAVHVARIAFNETHIGDASATALADAVLKLEPVLRVIKSGKLVAPDAAQLDEALLSLKPFLEKAGQLLPAYGETTVKGTASRFCRQSKWDSQFDEVKASLDKAGEKLLLCYAKMVPVGGQSEPAEVGPGCLYLCMAPDASMAGAASDGEALYYAARAGDAAAVRRLLSPQTINWVNAEKNGETPLWAGSVGGNAAVVSLLVAVPGCDVNLANSKGATPLYAAASCGRAAACKVLAAQPGIDISKAADNGKKPFDVATEECRVAMRAAVAEAKAKVEAEAQTRARALRAEEAAITSSDAAAAAKKAELQRQKKAAEDKAAADLAALRRDELKMVANTAGNCCLLSIIASCACAIEHAKVVRCCLQCVTCNPKLCADNPDKAIFDQCDICDFYCSFPSYLWNTCKFIVPCQAAKK